MRSHILEAYEFLVRFHSQGDRIYLIGFSRGAFTARALAGMLNKVGLVKQGNENLIDLAYQCYISWEYGLYTSEITASTTLVNEFKRTFSRADTPIHFMGLWDSVNSVGLLKDRIFPNTSRTSQINHIRHAVSIDERRAKFKQCLFHQPHEVKIDIVRHHSEPGPLSFHSSSTSSSQSSSSSSNSQSSSVSSGLLSARIPSFGLPQFFPSMSNLNLQYMKTSTDLIEKWFCGDHCDVGGGWPDINGARLSNVSFNWMVGEAHHFGVLMKKLELSRLKIRDPRIDASSCIHDELVIGAGSNSSRCVNTNPFYYGLFWWLGEILPMSTNVEDHQGKWCLHYAPNLGKHREIPAGAQLHWSVYWRLKNDPTYRPVNLPADIDINNIDCDEFKDDLWFCD